MLHRLRLPSSSSSTSPLLIVVLLTLALALAACSATSTSSSNAADASSETGTPDCTPSGMICCGGDYGGIASCDANGKPVCPGGQQLVAEGACFQPCDPRNPTPPPFCGGGHEAGVDASDAGADGNVASDASDASDAAHD
jgi:hypothetical protein